MSTRLLQHKGQLSSELHCICWFQMSIVSQFCVLNSGSDKWALPCLYSFNVLTVSAKPQCANMAFYYSMEVHRDLNAITWNCVVNGWAYVSSHLAHGGNRQIKQLRMLQTSCPHFCDQHGPLTQKLFRTRNGKEMKIRRAVSLPFGEHILVRQHVK